jgi:hypothetical protein
MRSARVQQCLELGETVAQFEIASSSALLPPIQTPSSSKGLAASDPAPEGRSAQRYRLVNCRPVRVGYEQSASVCLLQGRTLASDVHPARLRFLT